MKALESLLTIYWESDVSTLSSPGLSVSEEYCCQLYHALTTFRPEKQGLLRYAARSGSMSVQYLTSRL